MSSDLLDRTHNIPLARPEALNAEFDEPARALDFKQSHPEYHELRQLRARVAELELAMGVGQEKAWLVERELWEGTPIVYAFLRLDNGRARINWTAARDEALRFARREDASAFMQLVSETVRLQGVTRVAEHVWQT